MMGLSESRLPPEPVADRRNGGKTGCSAPDKEDQLAQNVRDQMPFERRTPEGMNVTVHHARDQAKHRPVKREVLRIPALLWSGSVAHAADARA